MLWSASVGLGGGMLRFDEAAVAVDAAISLAQGNRRYTLHASQISEFRICVFGCPTLENLSEISALYGLMNKKRYGYVSASAGIGVVYHVNQDDDGSVGPGFPAMAEAYWTPFTFLGVGTTVNVNVNPYSTTWTWMFGIQAGRLAP